MWLLENAGDVFEGKRLWLRPGKLYLFGRTASEPGQLAISDKTISRKHLTIRVGAVPEGGGRNIQTRSQVTIEDLNAKKGTLLNGTQIRGETHTITQDINEIKMGLCSKLFRVTWNPVVFSFSFTSKELRNDPWTKLRRDLEQLDIKYSAEYERLLTSHVVTKKRNTSKGLQALINGRYIVEDSFITAVVTAATVPDEAELGTTSALELDYDGNWPKPLEHLPPRGEEPSDRPPDAYAPDEKRREVFDGYTFVFYEKKQYENLFPAIAAGKGKALLSEVVPKETQVDDFIRYVKGVAGEKGLGSFEDGSEGKGVAVVRYLPAKGDEFDWFAHFLTSVALRLDHRPIDQREFLEAILACDASMLRRPLEEETQPPNVEASPQQPQIVAPSHGIDVDQAVAQTAAGTVAVEPGPAPQVRRPRTRRAAGSRFKGFDLDSDPVDVMMEVDSEVGVLSTETMPAASVNPQANTETAHATRQSDRKRGHSPIPEETDADVMDGIAPTAAAVKRRRIQAGEAPVPASAPSPDEVLESDEDAVPESNAKKGKGSAQGRKAMKEPKDILALAAQHRQEAEARAAAEREFLNNLPDDGIDYAAIRAMHIVEECTVREPEKISADAVREQDVASGRWDPRWNGRVNFKRFRKQGQPAGRPPARTIIGLEEVRAKEYGIGDDYWLDDDRGVRTQTSDVRRDSPSQAPTTHGKSARGTPKQNEKEKPTPSRRTIAIDSSDEEDESSVQVPATAEDELPRTRAAKVAERANTRRSQAQTQISQTQAEPAGKSQAAKGKRAAAGSPANQKAAKKPRKQVVEVPDSDSDDEPRFKFGRR